MTDISLLLIDYKKAAGAYGKANENFDNIAANTEHEKLMRLYSQLKKIGDHSFKELRVYLKDKDNYVALWAATHLIDKYPEEAKETLNNLMKEDSMVAMTAEAVLDLWKTGKLTL